jgi:hypothetical protein
MKKIIFAFICVLAAAGVLSAQTQGAEDAPSGFSDFFPEAAEIGASSRTFSPAFEDTAGLAKVTDGKLVSDVGFTRYERADYSGALPLSIEVFTLLDSHAAYSLLTLLRENHVQPGPPGDAFTAGNDGFLFARGRLFVRIMGKGEKSASSDMKELLEKSAAAIGAKMERVSSGAQPGLFAYFPPEGYDASSLRYFPSQDAYKTWTKGNHPEYIDTNYDMEIATARYSAGNGSGTVSMLKFPTPELAEEYYDELAASISAVPGSLSIYARRAGPLVACLEGNFDPVSAHRLLSGVKFGYSLHWIDDDGKNGGVVWGIPKVILQAVVNSLIFSLTAGVAAVLIGLMIGAGWFLFRQYKDKRNPRPLEEDPYFNRLNLKR